VLSRRHFSPKDLNAVQRIWKLLNIGVGISCKKTKYHPIADTMRISQVLKNLRYHLNSGQDLMDL